MISCLGWNNFTKGTGVSEPLLLPFRPYSKDILFFLQSIFQLNFFNLCVSLDIVTILSQSLRQLGHTATSVTCFVELVYDVFYKACKDLHELTYIVATTYPLYMKPVEEGKGNKFHDGLEKHPLKMKQPK
jgi:hypothetical protein